jgi:hypothetical protein
MTAPMGMNFTQSATLCASSGVSRGPALVEGIVTTGVVLEVVVVGMTVVKLAAVTSTVDVELDDLLGDDEHPAIRHAPTMTSAVRVLVAIVVHPCPWQPRCDADNNTSHVVSRTLNPLRHLGWSRRSAAPQSTRNRRQP